MVGPLLEPPSTINVQRKILSRIVKQFPHYLEIRKEMPTKEKDIQDRLETVLRLTFPDVVREVNTPKPTKTYRPDFGIESIYTAVEVKFAADQNGAKAALGELYEDMKGYVDSAYSWFVAFVYMTGNFLTQEQVEAEMAKVSAPSNWKVHVVVGGSAPKPRKLIAKSAGKGSDPA